LPLPFAVVCWQERKMRAMKSNRDSAKAESTSLI